MKTNVWLTIGHLVAAGLVPDPPIVARFENHVNIKVRTPADVDRWQRHLMMPPAIDNRGEYGSAWFPPAPGWCGYTYVTVYCDAPRAVRTAEEIRAGVSA